jgi:hypothetical protein
MLFHDGKLWCTGENDRPPSSRHRPTLVNHRGDVCFGWLVRAGCRSLHEAWAVRVPRAPVPFTPPKGRVEHHLGCLGTLWPQAVVVPLTGTPSFRYKDAIQTCVRMNNWGLAVDLAHAHPDQVIDVMASFVPACSRIFTVSSPSSY